MMGLKKKKVFSLYQSQYSPVKLSTSYIMLIGIFLCNDSILWLILPIHTDVQAQMLLDGFFEKNITYACYNVTICIL